MAEREGFEPPVPFGTTVFKTAALNRSAISPNWDGYYNRFWGGKKLLTPAGPRE